MNRRPLFRFPLTVLAVIVSLYVVFTILTMLGDWTWDWRSVRVEMWPVRETLLGFGCMIAGVVRVSAFHPRFATKYGAWLSSTPWCSGQNPPLGPIMLVWEDLLLVVPLGILAALDTGIPAWVPVAFYLLGFSILAVTAMRSDRTVWFGFTLLLLCSLPLLWYGQIIVLAAVLLVLVALAHIALTISLRHFPWDLGNTMRDFKRHPSVGLAWPLNRVGPAESVKPIEPMVGFAAAALCGWWVYVGLKIWLVGYLGEVLGPLVVIKFLPIFCATAGLCRIIAYSGGCWPPISLLGRLMTGRFIIPGYDYVVISPLLMAAFGYVLPRILSTQLSLPITGGITVACVTAIGLNGGPTLRRWRLTGHHRLFPGGRREPPVPKGRAAQMNAELRYLWNKISRLCAAVH